MQIEERELLDVNKDIFISYSHDDSITVHAVYEELIKSFKSVWIDKEGISIGGKYNEEIFEAIKNCKVFIAFFSRSYVIKDYCEKEFNNAINKKKNILAICVDDVNEDIAKKMSYMLDYCAGQDILGYGTGINGISAAEISDMIIRSLPFQTLDKYYDDGCKGEFPKISVSDYIMDNLKSHLSKQYRQEGNYFISSELSSNLFPAIKKIKASVNDEELLEEVISDSENQDNRIKKEEIYKGFDKPPLAEYLNENESGKSSHIFMYGEGGAGKTVSLLETTKFLYNQNRYAIYIPLKHINKDNTLLDYIKNNVFKGNLTKWEIVEAAAHTTNKNTPPVVLLLDGLNELASEYLNSFINYLAYSFIPGHQGVQIIMTSRSNSSRELGKLKEEFAVFEFCHLDNKCIRSYVESKGLAAISNDELIKILHTPLMLTLYCDSENCNKEYEADIENNDFKLFSNPDKTSKILHNYFQTQIYRAIKGDSFNKTLHLALLGYILPYLGCRMLYNNTFEMPLTRCQDHIMSTVRGNKPPCFEWYKDTKLTSINLSDISYNESMADKASSAIFNSLAFMHNENGMVRFSHQIFRDYFAALYVCLELRCINACKKSKQEVYKVEHPVIERVILPDEVLSFVSDILEEDKYEPVMVDNEWISYNEEEINNDEEDYDPWSDDVKGSSCEVENASTFIKLWRHQEGINAQRAVYNLFEILKIGRNKKLFFCDFSYLDLRMCDFVDVIFSEWSYLNRYTASFEGAYIDKKCFAKNGHSATVTAVCTDGNGFIYTGDLSGVVMKWSMDSYTPLNVYKGVKGKIIRLIMDKNLIVLTPHKLFILENDKLIKLMETRDHLVSARYNNEGKIEVKYDTHPSTWYGIDVNIHKITKKAFDTPLDVDYMGMSGCARLSPCGNYMLCSDCFGRIAAYKRAFNQEFIKCFGGISRMVKNTLKKNQRIVDIFWHESGNKVLIAFPDAIVECLFNLENGLIYNRHYKMSGNINCVCYLGDNIIVGHSIHATILDKDFITIKKLEGNLVPNIRMVKQKTELVYLLFSDNELKILDKNVELWNVRKVKPNIKDMCFGRNLLSNKKSLCFIYDEGKREKIEIYNLYANRYSQLPSNMKFLFDDDDFSDKPFTVYKEGNTLVLINHKSNQIYEYEGIHGVYINGCSFKDIKGNILESDNIKIIKQNGGIC